MSEMFVQQKPKFLKSISIYQTPAGTVEYTEGTPAEGKGISSTGNPWV